MKRTVNMWLQVAVSDGLTVRTGSAAHKSVTGSDGPVVEQRSKPALGSMPCKTACGTDQVYLTL